MLVGGGARVGGRLGIVLVILVGLAVFTLGWFSQVKLVQGNWDPTPWRGGGCCWSCCWGSGPGFDPYIPEGLATEGRSGSTEPPFGGISKDFSWYFTPNRKKTGRLTGFGVKCRLFGGGRGGGAPTSAPPTPANPSQAMVVKMSYSA
ncbi:hypothetical protein FRC0501_01862 [Corynebacterium diphtheriae]|nr:hypothetical protein FRC0501_01862 [Corynebacterium diphtheriae]